jgi:hypothetical protein
MENQEQSTELASSESVTPESKEVVAETSGASDVQPEVKKEVVSTEPRHPLMDVLDKAAEKAKAKEAAPKEVKKEGLAEKAPETFDYSKWDGATQSLPEKLQKIVKDNQAAFTEKAKEAATFKQQYDELQAKVNNYLQEIDKQKQAKPLFSQEEFEAAQLDPNKFLELTQRVAKNIVDAEKAQIAPLMNQLQFNQQVVENERVINDFASKNPDFWQLYDAKILEPFVKEHGLEKGYAMAKEVAAKFEQQATQKSQARVNEKKGAITSKPTNTQSIEVTYVDRPEDVLPTAMRYAAEGKHVKVKVRTH